jgi:hypothetical protein
MGELGSEWGVPVAELEPMEFGGAPTGYLHCTLRNGSASGEIGSGKGKVHQHTDERMLGWGMDRMLIGPRQSKPNTEIN